MDAIRDALIHQLIESALDSNASGRPEASLADIALKLRAALAAQPAADDVLAALDLSPEQFRTEGGAINRGKLRAAILHPSEYLPESHWLRAQPAASGEAPSVETLLAQARELARVTAERPGQAVAIPELLSTEGRKFMRGEPSLFDRAPLGDLQEVGGAMSACPHDVPHRWPCAECDAAPTPAQPTPEERQRARVQERFANRPQTPATADFDLPAASDAVEPAAHPPVAPEPDMRHPKIQRLIGAKARREIELGLVEQLLEDPECDLTSLDMEYWGPMHDRLKAALTARKP